MGFLDQLFMMAGRFVGRTCCCICVIIIIASILAAQGILVLPS